MKKASVKATKNTKAKKNSRKRNRMIKIAVCSILVGAFVYTLISQQITLANIRRETAECSKEIADSKEKYSRLKEKAKYNSSDEFYEDKARDEGYVREGETVFVVGN